MGEIAEKVQRLQKEFEDAKQEIEKLNNDKAKQDAKIQKLRDTIQNNLSIIEELEKQLEEYKDKCAALTEESGTIRAERQNKHRVSNTSNIQKNAISILLDDLVKLQKENIDKVNNVNKKTADNIAKITKQADKLQQKYMELKNAAMEKRENKKNADIDLNQLFVDIPKGATIQMVFRRPPA
ncbi:hypothetical protein GPJ56_009889 [Histomonas meleagridis]|uniref:uncharacterized protein n=1 Tax=Histomonas meleagridis TaxID=135588 RepID=UPI003559BAC9|nr:hypothetical protein GPJ56_009889 [Histomonas meleagridis]KAH0802805.1 hypothetical protein GO595_004312 [Histomonas meleagridis]